MGVFIYFIKKQLDITECSEKIDGNHCNKLFSAKNNIEKRDKTFLKGIKFYKRDLYRKYGQNTAIEITFVRK